MHQNKGKAIADCLAHGLSIVENPRRSDGDYGKWLGDKKPHSHLGKLRT